MNEHLLTKQHGITLIGFLMMCALVGIVALGVMRLFPLYNEKFRATSAMETVANMPEIRSMTTRQIEESLLKHFYIDDIDRFNKNNIKEYLEISRDDDGQGRTMSLEFEARAELVGDLDVVLKFDKSVAIEGTGTGE